MLTKLGDFCRRLRSLRPTREYPVRVWGEFEALADLAAWDQDDEIMAWDLLSDEVMDALTMIGSDPA